ncbi:hypothetical protein Gogos_021314 [Gossypium gossypioides]|uniref:Uncharacterized protein n=1 Tax=Gossypium gossypioides TaxID=34282 RepID=A0A7J9CZX0_GOSGO|nr:hypothetical protein [Gossypium gossypioides]
MIVKLLLMNMLVILQHQMEWIMLLLQVVEKRRMGMRLRKAGCRLLIGLDGCFLKGSFKSEFLTAVGRDENNQIFPIAWVVVEVECTD